MTPQMCQYAIASGLALVLGMLGSRCFGFCGLWPTHSGCILPRFHRNILPCRCSLWSLVPMDDAMQPSQQGIQHSLGACVSLGSFCCCGWWPTGTSAVPSQLFCHVAVRCDRAFRAEVLAGCALTVGDRSETENLRPVLSRVGEFSDLFLPRSEASLWSPTFSDPFWPTSDPSIATHSTRTCYLEPQADKPRPRVVPLSQPQISKLLKTTCPVQCGPHVLVHFLRRQDFLDRAVAKCLRILIIQTKKGKFAKKNTTNSWYKEALGKLTHS